MKTVWLTPVVILVLAACNLITQFFGLHSTLPQQQQAEIKVAPEFSFTTFDGQTYSLADFRGKVVVINFWASWCAPCRLEAPILESLWQRYKDRSVVFIGIAYVDLDSESIAYLEENGFTFLNGNDPQTKIADAYNVLGIPETFIIDQQGYIVNHISAIVTEQEVVETLEQLLAQP